MFPDSEKVAVTWPFAVSVKVHEAPVPIQAPCQLAKVEFVPAEAVRVILVPDGKVALQTVPQLIPAGLLLTVPVPLPASVTVNVGDRAVNVAVTERLLAMVTLHVAVPLHAPLHPPKTEPPAGAAVRVTSVPDAKLALHTCPQLIPAGLLLTVPDPVPASVTLNVGDGELKVAVTVRLWVTVTLHVVAPLQAPDQPAKTEEPVGVAVRVTSVPGGKLALQVFPQLMPAGLLLTVPVPVPARVSVSTGAGLNVALTEVFPVSVNLQDPVPLQAPPHPTNDELAFAVAESATDVFGWKSAAQFLSHLIPAGLLVMVPAPLPLIFTASCTAEGEELALPPQPPKANSEASENTTVTDRSPLARYMACLSPSHAGFLTKTPIGWAK